MLETRCDSPCQLGVLTSESFSQRMMSAANLLVDTRRLHLNNEMADKMITLHMSKRLMERVRTKNDFSSAMFGSILSDGSAKV